MNPDLGVPRSASRLLCWIAFGLTVLGSSPAASTTVSWVDGVSGDWSEQERWLPAQVPGEGDDVLISAPATRAYNVEISSPASAHSLVLNSPGRILLSDSLTSPSIRLEGGALSMLGGNLVDSDVELLGGSLVFTASGGQFSNVMIHGDLNLVSGQNAQYIILQDGSSFTGTGNIRVPGGRIIWKQSGTIDNSFNIQNGAFEIYERQTLSFGATSNITILNGSIDQVSGLLGTLLTNSGVINTTGNDVIDLDRFTNAGTINISGTRLGLSSDRLINSSSGTINVLHGWLDMFAQPLNQGVINLSPDANLQITGISTLDGLGTITRSAGDGQIVLRSKNIDNAGRTFTLNANTGSYFLAAYGEVGSLVGGRVKEEVGASLYYGKDTVLSDVEVEGDLELSSQLISIWDGPETPSLALRNGTTFTGRANLSVPGASLLIDQEMVVNNRFELSGAGSRLAAANGRTLTLDTAAFVNLTGGGSQLGSGLASGQDTLINRGTIRAAPEGGSARIAPASFSNSGTLEVSRGVLTVDAPGVGNLANQVLTGGTWRALDATLSIEGTGGTSPIAINRANVVLSGAGARFDSLNSLSINDVEGELHLLDGGDFATSNAFRNSGVLELHGGTFRASGFTNTGSLEGRGLLAADLTSSGILAPDGELEVDGLLALAFGSVLDIDLEGTARFDRVRVTGNAVLGGTLRVSRVAGSAIAPGDVFTILEAGGTLSGVFANLSSGERIDVAGGTLLLTIGDGSVSLSGFEAPEPSPLALLGSGLVAWALMRRRRDAAALRRRRCSPDASRPCRSSAPWSPPWRGCRLHPPSA